MSDFLVRRKEWERRFEAILVEMMRYRTEGYASLHCGDTAAAAATFQACLDAMQQHNELGGALLPADMKAYIAGLHAPAEPFQHEYKHIEYGYRAGIGFYISKDGIETPFGHPPLGFDTVREALARRSDSAHPQLSELNTTKHPREILQAAKAFWDVVSLAAEGQRQDIADEIDKMGDTDTSNKSTETR